MSAYREIGFMDIRYDDMHGLSITLPSGHSDLMTQTVTFIGSMDGSGTNAIMIKLENQRSICLRTIVESSLDKGEYEKWS